VAVTLVDRGIRAQAVQILLAVNIPNPNTLALGKDNIQGFVIMSAVFVFKFDIVFRIHLFLS
jgi:hypothetical protein